MDIGLAKHLKLNQLRLISVISEHGQLGIAADEMAMTQPATIFLKYVIGFAYHDQIYTADECIRSLFISFLICCYISLL